MDKSPDAFRTITEVADWLDTPAHVLRFWESRFSQIKPVKRAGGRRYYRPADMLLLGGIKKLLHGDGTTIKAVQNILREQGIKHVQSLSQPVSVNVAIKKKTAASKVEKASVVNVAIKKKDILLEPETSVPAQQPEHINQDELANFARVNIKKKPDIPDIHETHVSKISDQIEAPNTEFGDDLYAGLEDVVTSSADILKFPSELKAPVDISAKDMQDIEALFYSLKMVRNNMKRTNGIR